MANYWVRAGDSWEDWYVSIQTPTILEPRADEECPHLKDKPHNFITADSLWHQIDMDRLLASDAVDKVVVFPCSDSGATENTHWFFGEAAMKDDRIVVWPIFCKVHHSAIALREVVQLYLKLQDVNDEDWQRAVWIKCSEHKDDALAVVDRVMKYFREEPITQLDVEKDKTPVRVMEEKEFMGVLERISSCEDPAMIERLEGLLFHEDGRTTYRGILSPQEQKQLIANHFETWYVPNYARWLTYFQAVTVLLMVLCLRIGYALGCVPDKFAKKKISPADVVLHLYFTMRVCRPITVHSKSALSGVKRRSVRACMERFEEALALELEGFTSGQENIFRDLKTLLRGCPGVNVESPEFRSRVMSCIRSSVTALHASRSIIEARCGCERESHWSFLSFFQRDPIAAAEWIITDTGIPDRVCYKDPGSMTVRTLQRKCIQRFESEVGGGLTGVIEYLTGIERVVLAQPIHTARCEKKVGSVKRIQNSTSPKVITTLTRQHVRREFYEQAEMIRGLCEAALEEQTNPIPELQDPTGSVMGIKLRQAQKEVRKTNRRKRKLKREKKANGRPRKYPKVSLEEVTDAQDTQTTNSQNHDSQVSATSIDDGEKNDSDSAEDSSDAALPAVVERALPSFEVLDIANDFYKRRENLARNWWRASTTRDDRETLEAHCIRANRPIILEFGGMDVKAAVQEVIAKEICLLISAMKTAETKRAKSQKESDEQRIRKALKDLGGDILQNSKYADLKSPEKKKRKKEITPQEEAEEQRRAEWNAELCAAVGKQMVVQLTSGVVGSKPPTGDCAADSYHALLDTDGTRAEAFDISNNVQVNGNSCMPIQRSYWLVCWTCNESHLKEAAFCGLEMREGVLHMTGETLQSRRAGRSESRFFCDTWSIQIAEPVGEGADPQFRIVSTLSRMADIPNADPESRSDHTFAPVNKNFVPDDEFAKKWQRIQKSHERAMRQSSIAINIQENPINEPKHSKSSSASAKKSSSSSNQNSALADSQAIAPIAQTQERKKPQLADLSPASIARFKSDRDTFDQVLTKFEDDESSSFLVSGFEATSSYTALSRERAVDRLQVRPTDPTVLKNFGDFCKKYGPSAAKSNGMIVPKNRIFHEQPSDDLMFCQHFLYSYGFRMKCLLELEKTSLRQPVSGSSSSSSSSSSSAAVVVESKSMKLDFKVRNSYHYKAAVTVLARMQFDKEGKRRERQKLLDSLFGNAPILEK